MRNNDFMKNYGFLGIGAFGVELHNKSTYKKQIKKCSHMNGNQIK